ncbi:MAG: 2Fe-2S iron-sulfur cluster-binding protein, partial [Planctomycetota bacterium]
MISIPDPKLVTLSVDGMDVTVPEGTMILQAAREVDVDIPTLCQSDMTKPHGACRVCMVEIDGKRPSASCHTPVAQGMKVTTKSPFLQRLRHNIVELVVSDHPLECLTCSANGRCELQDVAAKVGLRDVRYENPQQHRVPKDFSHPFIKADMTKCIMCQRCVRACDEVQGSFILGVEGRGFDAKIIMGNGTGFEEAGCASCGACVVECPVAALEEPGTVGGGLPEKT